MKKIYCTVEKAFLYGSYSSETETDDSDIDLIIVTNNKDADNDFIIGRIWQLTKKINSKIESFLIGLDRFNKNNCSPLINLIREKGIKIALNKPAPICLLDCRNQIYNSNSGPFKIIIK
ncbi:MAG: nucleotidyltransferase domain-containing protein [Deltaproteobacteria bacterium]|nr:nucleotidyltransferase domain-containing protein [Candidatus Tharpella aukensis]